MDRFVTSVTLAAFVGLAATACSSKSNNTPTTPSDNNTVVMTSTLLPQNEVPAVTNADSSGVGTVQVTFHLTRDASNNVTAATSDFVVNLNGFPAGTTLTGAHIHSGVAGTAAAGNIVVPLPLSAGEVVLTNGSGSFTKNTVTTDAAVAQNILANPTAFYFNVHDALNGGGFARGQLVKQ